MLVLKAVSKQNIFKQSSYKTFITFLFSIKLHKIYEQLLNLNLKFITKFKFGIVKPFQGLRFLKDIHKGII